MNEMLVDRIKEGLVGLRQLLAGKHLRPAELALTIMIVAAYPEKAAGVYSDEGKQARWEVANGEAETNGH